MDNFIILAIDTERTGDGPCDETFSVGLAYSLYYKDKKHPIVRKRFTVRLPLAATYDNGKPRDASLLEWKDMWLRWKFDMQCFDEFWSKNIGILNELHKNNDSHFLRDSAAAVAQDIELFLCQMEASFPEHTDIVLVTNNVGMDVKCIDSILVPNGRRPILYSRTGKWLRGGIEIDSYIRGLDRIPLGKEHAAAMRLFKETIIGPLKREKTVHSHLPDDDAHELLILTIAANDYAFQN